MLSTIDRPTLAAVPAPFKKGKGLGRLGLHYTRLTTHVLTTVSGPAAAEFNISRRGSPPWGLSLTPRGHLSHTTGPSQIPRVTLCLGESACSNLFVGRRLRLLTP